MATTAVEAFVFDLDGSTGTRSSTQPISGTLKVLLQVGHPRSPPKVPKPPTASAPLWLRHSSMDLCVSDTEEHRTPLLKVPSGVWLGRKETPFSERCPY